MIPLGIMSFDLKLPMPPVTSGLVLDLQSRYGVELSGTEVIGWKDQSGYGNDLVVSGNSPYIENQFFGNQRAIRLTTGRGLVSQNPISGVTGSQAITLFVVTNFTQPPTGCILVDYPDGGNGFTTYVQRPSSTTQTVILSSGNSGLLVRQADTTDNISTIYTYLMDYSTSPDTGLIYLNGSSASTQFINVVNNTDSFNGNYLSVVGAGGMTFHHGSVMMYNRALNENEIDSVTDFLKERYGIVY
jgi:hypothetical protein